MWRERVYDLGMMLPNLALIRYELVLKRVYSSCRRYSLCRFLDDRHALWDWRTQMRYLGLVMGIRSKNLGLERLGGGKMMNVVEFLVNLLVSGCFSVWRQGH